MTAQLEIKEQETIAPVAVEPHTSQHTSQQTQQQAEPAKSLSTDSPQNTNATARPGKANLIKIAVLIALAGAAIVGGTFGWNYLTSHQETDDAYLTAHITPVSSRIEANVERVLVDDNQFVHQGQEIIVLDSRDFVRKVNEAKAALEHAQREANVASRNISFADVTAEASNLNASGNVSSTTSGIDKANASIQEAQFALDEQRSVLQQKEAELVRSKLDYQRYDELEKQGAVTTSSKDATLRDYNVAVASVAATNRVIEQKQAALEGARQQLKIALAAQVQSQGTVRTAEATDVQASVTRLQKEVAMANVKEAEERLKTALLNLSYTSIKAPISGRIGRKTVEIGQRVLPGGRLLTLTGEDLWVVANYKENQLEKIKIGQPVEIKIDALPHEKFEGLVDSFSPGSGAQFTLLPPDNATGNFTKITQRVPVKIRFNTKGFSQEKIVPGLSCTTSVDVSK